MHDSCTCGSETYLCQVCARVFCDNTLCPNGRASEWIKGKGNVCARCLGGQKEVQ
jgi:hypothetical protein